MKNESPRLKHELKNVDINLVAIWRTKRFVKAIFTNIICRLHLHDNNLLPKYESDKRLSHQPDHQMFTENRTVRSLNSFVEQDFRDSTCNSLSRNIFVL